ncbi:MAG: MFS transporter, partial [Zymomonas sp.]
MNDQTSAEPYAATRTQRSWLLGVLVSVYASNFVDRTIVNILQQPIKEELLLQDWQLGLLGGTTFAIFYTLLGLYIARLAEKGDRVTVLTFCIVAWSAFTALCGVVTTFTHLLLLRIGVAIGEAGATPASHSLIS